MFSEHCWRPEKFYLNSVIFRIIFECLLYMCIYMHIHMYVCMSISITVACKLKLSAFSCLLAFRKVKCVQRF